MRTRIVFLLVSVALLVADSPWQAGATSPTPTLGIAGQVLVLVEKPLDESQATSLALELGGYTLIKGPRKVATGTLLTIEVPKGQELKVVQNLRQDPRVFKVDLNYLRSAPRSERTSDQPEGRKVNWLQATHPNDPIYREGQWNLTRVRLPEAWDYSRGTGVTIGHLDTGIWWDFGAQQTHPDLAGKVLWSQGWDFVNDDDFPWDDGGHGTMTAGLAAAATNNGLGIAAAGWEARLLPVKVLNGEGDGDDAKIAAGITYAVDHGAKVLLMPFGGPSHSSILEAAINYAWNRGAFLASGVGYEPDGARNYPAAYGQVLAVTSIGYQDEHCDRSTIGDWLTRQAVAAPGCEVYVTTPWAPHYEKVTGNSFATALVAGAAALFAARGESNAWIRQAFQETARPLGDSRVFGKGLLDVEAARQWDPNRPGPTETPRPTKTPPPASTPTGTPPPIVTIWPSPTPTATPVPQLVVEPDKVVFLIEQVELEERSQVVTISGIRLDGMPWETEENPEPWLEIEPSFGVIPQEVTITVNPASLGSSSLGINEYTAAVVFNCHQAYNGSATVTVKVVIVAEIWRIHLPLVSRK